MADERGTLHALAQHLALALEPLIESTSDLPAFRTLMHRLGWDATSLPPEIAALSARVQGAIAAVGTLSDDPTPAEVLQALEEVRGLYAAATSITTAPEGVDPAAFLSEIGQSLFELLLTDYLRAAFPNVHAALLSLDILQQRYLEETPGRPDALVTRIRWDQIPEVLNDPGSIPARVYGWGTDDLEWHLIAGYLLDFFLALDWPAYIGRVDASLGSGFKDDPGDHDPATSTDWQLKLPILQTNIGGKEIELGLAILELPAQGGKPAGLVVQPLVPPEVGQSFPISEALRLELRAGSDVSQTFGVLVRPDDIAVRYPLHEGGALPSAGFGAAFVYQRADAFRIFGDPGGVRLEGKSAKFLLDLDVKQGQPELRASVAPEELTLVLEAGDLDGFLGSILGGRQARIAFPLRLSWSSRTGLDFVAGLGFEVSVYPHLDLGLVRFDRVDLGLRSVTADGDEPPKLELRVASALSGSLGPIGYSADGLGVLLPVAFAPGNAGPFDIDFGVLLPTAIGLAINSGPVSGGGFIQRDPDKGRYSGMLELSMFEIAASAVGVLETKDAAGEKLPPPGYSLFIAVSAEFSPIQLGYGFTLNGVGGIAAVHRRVDVEAVSSRLREGVLDGVMFPKDPVKNAPAIISNLTTVFPIAMGRYVFGPMAIIGWGAPTLVRAKLAVLLEVPEPVLIVILGQASVAIPPEVEKPAIVINVDFVGVLDYARSSFALDATLRDSSVVGVAITGDMAMRLVWAGKRNLVIAIGGLHPHFAPPPGFPSLRRITLALGKDNPRITIEGYYALTSNSRQFGAKAELYAAAAGFSLNGWLYFDALFTVRPLWFRIDFDAGMTLKRGSRRIAGVTVRGALTGPSPFHAWGEGCVSLFFFDVCVPFDVTFGQTLLLDLPGKDPWPLLKAAIESAESWAAELGRGVASAATMRPLPPGGPGLLLHPMGAATLRQHVLPLNRPLERFGEFEITGPSRFDVKTVHVGGSATSGSDWTIAEDDFAPGDFEALSETDRLSRDSFERMAAGVTVGGDLVDTPDALMKVAKVAYETRIIDEGVTVRTQPLFDLSRLVQLFTVNRGAKARSGFASSGRAKFAREAARDVGVTLRPETYVAATADTLALRADITTATTSGAARLAVKSKLGRGAKARGVQVVPDHELEGAA